MNVIHYREANVFPNNPECTAYEYPIGDPDFNGTLIELRGRYPAEGRVVNTHCKELAYVVNGSGKLVIEGETVMLSTRDQVLIEAGERFFWDGEMDLFMVCVPTWFAEQHQQVE